MYALSPPLGHHLWDGTVVRPAPAGNQDPTLGSRTTLYFHFAFEFATQSLAHMLDSLVRVSRRVRWVADTDAADLLYHSGTPTTICQESRGTTKAETPKSNQQTEQVTQDSGYGAYPIQPTRSSKPSGVLLQAEVLNSTALASSRIGRGAHLPKMHPSPSQRPGDRLNPTSCIAAPPVSF